MNNFTWLQKLRNKIRIKGTNNHIVVEKSQSSKISKNKIYIKGNNNTLHIHKSVNIRNTFIEIVGNNCNIIIGENCIIGDDCYLSAKEESIELTIGNDCMLSRNAKIMTSDGHPIYSNDTVINSAKSIHIANNVWLADNVTILKSVTIEEFCVVGIDAVVTKSIKKNSITAGNPAQIIKENITWSH